MTRWIGTVVAVAISDVYPSPASAWRKLQAISKASPLSNWRYGSIFKLQDPFSFDFKTKISDTYRIFAELARDRKLIRVFKKPAKVSPVEFTTIGLLVFVHKDTLTMVQLSDAIAKRRDDVRATYADIMMGSMTMIDFIKLCQCLKFQETRVDQLVRPGVWKRTEQQHENEDEEIMKRRKVKTQKPRKSLLQCPM